MTNFFFVKLIHPDRLINLFFHPYRLVEIWCPSVASREDLIALMELHIGLENTKVISEAVLDFVKWYDDQQVCVKVPFTIRDLVAWMTFIKDSG